MLRGGAVRSLLAVIFLLSKCIAFSASNCDRERFILTKEQGEISDGPDNYTEDSYCKWLIKAGKLGQYINLWFTSLNTECSYDHIFIYDGHTFNTTLLGTFSGNTVPPPLYARSGYMLILLYSDTNYNLAGFEAKYTVTDCPLSCQNRGDCENGLCNCSSKWRGKTCDIPVCPDNCGEKHGRGVCRKLPAPTCVCSPGYTGEGCRLHDRLNGNEWYTLTRESDVFTPRASHAGAYIADTDRLYVFGGFDLNHVLDDFLVLDFRAGMWFDVEDSNDIHELLKNFSRSPEYRKGGSPSPHLLTNDLMLAVNNKSLTVKSKSNDSARRKRGDASYPRGRYGHAMCAYRSHLLMFGGTMEGGKLSNELWLFNTTENKWRVLGADSKVKPPGLTRHTLTLVNDQWIYLFGGSRQSGEFSSDMFRLDLEEWDRHQWEKVEYKGGKELRARLVGHSTVYHSASNSLLVFGGVEVDIARFSRLSSRLLIFSIFERYWSEIHYPQPEQRVFSLQRAFHSMHIIGNYLAIFGGYNFDHKDHDKVCHDKHLYFYHLTCHTWLSKSALSGNSNYPRTQGVFSHVAVTRDDMLVVAGGYFGAVTSDVIAYKVPEVIKDSVTHTPCHVYNTRESCVANPDCGWCESDKGTCLDRTRGGASCTSNLQSTQCLGLCAALDTCHSCTIHGSGLKYSPDTQAHDRLWSCAWCVQSRSCHPRHERVVKCGVPEETPSRVEGWWGRQGSDIKQPRDCQLLDYPPGITFLLYYSPPDSSHPDGVWIHNSTIFKWWPSSKAKPPEDVKMMGRLKGFIYPMERLPQGFNDLKLFIELRRGTAQLRISPPNATFPMEMVAESKTTTSKGKYIAEGHRRTGVMFPVTKKGERYLVNFNATFESAKVPTDMQLLWNGKESREILTSEFLQPYSNGNCGMYENCMACLSDQFCGWCDLHDSCVARDSTSSTVGCSDNNITRYLILHPRQCNTCSDYITCDSCLRAIHCEWLIEEARCFRLGRKIAKAITNIENCPVPCENRAGCHDCLGLPGRCAWCEHTQECFLFSTFTSRFQFGLCREWMDEGQDGDQPHISVCRNCSLYSNCSTCLQNLACGWCYSKENPTIGVCEKGGFPGPDSKADTCLKSVSRSTKKDWSEDEVEWAYKGCPDVDECALDLHVCHPNATCNNTNGSYDCICNRGFKGNGRSQCEGTCYDECIHGKCSGEPDFTCECDLGWTGKDCSINCGCNNHSECSQGVGICDKCMEWTTGANCELCKVGSYGNATTEKGCQECKCNNHGNWSLGSCNTETGKCYCTNKTMGDNCELCQEGYYGDPSDGGQCFWDCTPRGFLHGERSGGLGSNVIMGKQDGPEDCLWIISTWPDLKDVAHRAERSRALIELRLLPKLNADCSSPIRVFDGLPGFVYSTRNWRRTKMKVLGVFCEGVAKYPVTMIARTGYLTVHYKRINANKGFNSTYVILKCPHDCPPPRKCINQHCTCPVGERGSNCELIRCPLNCTDHGVCDTDYGICKCKEGWGGGNCSERISYSSMVLERYFSPRLTQGRVDHFLTVMPRFGHTLTLDHRGNLWAYGGYSWSWSQGAKGDIQKFNTARGSWEEVQLNVEPLHASRPPVHRFFHAAAYVPSHRCIYVYGGYTGVTILQDFWKFHIDDHQWTQIEVSHNALWPPPLAGHTLTLQNVKGTEGTLVLIGGISSSHGLFDSMMEYDLKDGEWRFLKVQGSVPLGIYGHSTAFHSPSQSFYVYGGMVYLINRLVLSSELLAMQYSSDPSYPCNWTAVPVEAQINLVDEGLPGARYLHDAVTTDDYMIVIGGLMSEESRDSTNLTLVAYSFPCNMWMRLMSEDIEVVGKPMRRAGGVRAELMKIYQESKLVSVIVWVFGGFAGEALGSLFRIRLPPDLCNLYANNKARCKALHGCGYSMLYEEEQGNNVTYCYSNLRDPPSSSDHRGSEFSRGLICNQNWNESRDCYQYKTCAHCLAHFPVHPRARKVCKWCSKCREGRCVPMRDSCPNKEQLGCTSPSVSSDKPELCPDRMCIATDCRKCTKTDKCNWTRQVLRSSEFLRQYRKEPVYDWDCFNFDTFPFNFTVDEKPCPLPCHLMTNCSSCLSHTGAEGGSRHCVWATLVNQCMSPNHWPLLCMGGVCGEVLSGKEELCPLPCHNYTQCSHCLQNPRCGWCMEDNGGSTDGLGVCMKGSLEGPANGSCGSTSVAPTASHNSSQLRSSNHSWHYEKCPPEDECNNNHHTCDQKSEKCVDDEEGYHCICSTGYQKQGLKCHAVCTKGCYFGDCVEPENCSCHFGYVGNNCSIECLCNGHSDCEGPDALDNCLQCRNNTMGNQCEKCQPLFVGDPRDGGVCQSCTEYCNGHSHICTAEELAEKPNINEWLVKGLQIKDLKARLKEGVLKDAVCLNCANNTIGNQCQECKTGTFRGSESKIDHCRPCQCHGHGDTCDAVTGEKCNCQNNTETDSPCDSLSSHSKSGNAPCNEVQCAKCKERYLGKPIGGLQCYRTMIVNTEFCFDPHTQDECTKKPNALYRGRTVYYAVQPKFRNVDIRIVVDVTKGGVQVFFAPKDDALFVNVDKENGWHNVTWNQKYNMNHKGRVKRSADKCNWKLQETSADGLTQFITLTDPCRVLLVNNLTDRLVITLPHHIHELRTTRFFLALFGVGSARDEATYGSIFFRQDQPRIDLFVFFSVFFSCFFLFLAACVVAWKVKLTVEFRRARIRRVVELMSMAKRPFASMYVILERSEELENSINSYLYSPCTRKKKLAKRGSSRGNGSDSPNLSRADSYSVIPVAVEPTDDGVAAINTVFVQLPGRSQTAVRLSLGSVLVYQSRVYPSQAGWNFLSRRTNNPRAAVT